MMQVQKIKNAVSRLPKVQLKEFRIWFEEFDAVQWDKEFEEDVESGKLNDLATQAISDFRKGQFKKI